MFPALIALTSLIGLVGDPAKTTDALLDIVDALGPSSAVDTFAEPVRQVAQNQSAGVALVLGLLAALWSASGYVGAFGRAANAIYEVEEGRPFYKLRPLQVLVTLICVSCWRWSRCRWSSPARSPRRSATPWGLATRRSPRGTSPSGRSWPWS